MKKIEREESTKTKLNEYLLKTFTKSNQGKMTKINERSSCERLWQTKPQSFNLSSYKPPADTDPATGGSENEAQNENAPMRPNLDNAEGPFELVRDYNDLFPSFQDMLYKALDWDMVHLYILYFFLFDYMWEGKKTMLAIFMTYMVERLLRKIRQDIGTANLTKKTLVNDRFMM